MTTFKHFAFEHLSIGIIISLLTAKMVSSFFENIFNGIFFYLTPDKFFYQFNKLYNCKKKKLNNNKNYIEDEKIIKFGIYYGSFIKDLIIWFICIFIFYIIKIILNNIK